MFPYSPHVTIPSDYIRHIFPRFCYKIGTMTLVVHNYIAHYRAEPIFKQKTQMCTYLMNEKTVPSTITCTGN